MSETEQPQPNEFPVPFAVFAATLRGTHDEVYTKLLKSMHGDRPRMPSDWHARLASVRNLPAT